MQQYFVKGLATSPVTIEDKETSKHMFQVMRLKEDDEVTLVFDDGIKRLARTLIRSLVFGNDMMSAQFVNRNPARILIKIIQCTDRLVFD